MGDISQVCHMNATLTRCGTALKNGGYKIIFKTVSLLHHCYHHSLFTKSLFL